MTLHTGRTVRLPLSEPVQALFRLFQGYVTSQGESYVTAAIQIRAGSTMQVAEDLAHYGLMRLVDEDGTRQIYELTREGYRAWREVARGARELTVTAQPERPSAATPPRARSAPMPTRMYARLRMFGESASYEGPRRHILRIAHNHGAGNDECNWLVTHGLAEVTTRSPSAITYELTAAGRQAQLDALAGITPMVPETIEDAAPVRDIDCDWDACTYTAEPTRSRRGVDIPEPKAAQEEVKPNPPANAMQPQRRLRNSRKKG